MFNKISRTYREYPPKFWLVVAVSFVDVIGGTILYPFFSLYITWKFDVGMTQAGVVLGIFSISRLVGNLIGGALTDKFGRRSIILFGLTFSAVSTLGLGLVNELSVLYPLAALIGVLSNIAGPAHQAMIADILPQEQRAEGYGVLRVMVNLAWIIGPTIGGIVANRSYFALFLIDAVVSLLVAIMFYFLISETKPESSPGKESENLLVTFQGYSRVLRNLAFLAFVLTSIVMGLVYVQMYNSMSVYMRDVHSLQPQSYGLLMSTSAVTVIFLQFWITRRTKSRPPFLMMAAGALFYMVGFGMFGFDPLSGTLDQISIGGINLVLDGTMIWFMLAMVVITLGEMIVMPVSQALAAGFADEETRGRYLAVYSMGMAVPSAVGPILAGLILDSPTLNPDLLWYLGALLCLIAAGGFASLQTRLGGSKRFAHAPLGKEPAPESAPTR